MKEITTNQTGTLVWTINKGASSEVVDLTGVTPVVHLLYEGGQNKIPLDYTFDADGNINATIGNLEPGVYGLRAYWQKKGKPLEKSEVRNVLFVSETDSVRPLTYTIKVKSYVNWFGYDGLNAYEMACMKGYTTLTEDEWIELQAGVASKVETMWKYLFDTPTITLTPTSTSGVSYQGTTLTATIKTTGNVGTLSATSSNSSCATATISDDKATLTISVKSNSSTARSATITVKGSNGGSATYTVSQEKNPAPVYYGYIPSSVSGFSSKASALVSALTAAMVSTSINNKTIVEATSLPITSSSPKTVTTSGKYGYFVALIPSGMSYVVKQFDGLSDYVAFDADTGQYANGEVSMTIGSVTYKLYAQYAATDGTEFKIIIS